MAGYVTDLHVKQVPYEEELAGNYSWLILCLFDLVGLQGLNFPQEIIVNKKRKLSSG